MELTETKYKQTEIGLIPLDWSVIRLGDYISLKNGYAFKSEYFSTNGPIVMTPGNFKLEGGLKFNEKNTIRYSGDFLKHMCFDRGDLIMVMTDLTPDCNLLGKSGIVDTNEVILHNQRIGKIIITKNEVLKEYLNIYFNSFLFSNRMKSTATGSTVRHTSVPTINNSKIILPTKEEQKAIATVLSDTDALIQALEKKIAKKKLIKKGVMQELLTPKDGWTSKSINEIFTLSAANSKKAFFSESGKYIVMDMGSVSVEGKILKHKKATCNFDILKKGDLVMPKDDIGGGNIIGKVGYIESNDRYVLSDHVYLLSPSDETINSLFASYKINDFRVNSSLRSKASGSAQLGLGRSQVLNQEILFPELDEQIHIAEILTDMDKEIEILEQKLSKYQFAKHGMMQQLLTGKIRLV